MKLCKALSLVAVVVLWAGLAFAQDPVKVDPAHYKVVFENASVRVLKIAYPAGAKSKVHQHPDLIVLPLSNAKVRFTLPDGTSQDAELTSDMPQYSPAGTHTPANTGTAPMEGLLVEFKAAAAGTATLPASRPGLDMKVLAEGPRAIAYRTTADPTFQEPAGTKHEYDQVVIALAPAQMSLAIDGKSAKTTWARGDAQFIGRGVPHESKNTSGKPIDFLIVAIK